MRRERPNVDGIIALGTGISGSPQTVAEVLGDQIVRSSAKYLVGQFAFGDFPLPKMGGSVEFFALEVTPACRAVSAEL